MPLSLGTEFALLAFRKSEARPMARSFSHRSLALLSMVFLTAVSSAAADGQHDHHELTESQLGAVHFPISCSSTVEKPFERGVALLHSFAFETAETAFRQVAKDDPQCAMAHWGIAKTFWRWGMPDAAQLKQGWEEIRIAESLHPGTARERDYVAALSAFYFEPDKERENRVGDYSKAMERIYRRYPEDHEAAAFYAFALISSEPENDTAYVYRKKAAAVLEPLFALEPNHPGVAHYLIHTYDKPGMAELGLPAARRYAKIAPDAPHALHMPSHIFARLGLWQDDIDSNLASAAASGRAALMHMGDEGHQFHAMEFLVYAYLQCGREADARRVIEEVKSLPKMNNMYGTDFDPAISALVAYSAAYALELHHWTEAANLQLLSPPDSGDRSITYKARAIGTARSDNVAEARTNLLAIEELHKTLLQRKKTTIANAVDEDRRVVLAWIDHADGKNEEAIKLLQEIAAKEEGIFAPDGGIPAHEMLGDMLMEMNSPQRALKEYESELRLNPNRFDSLSGAALAAEAAGQPKTAERYYAQLVKVCEGGNSERPELLRARSVLAASGQMGSQQSEF